MASLPTEINFAQEKLLHNILDEGINEMRKSQFDCTGELQSNKQTDSHIPDSPLITMKQRSATTQGNRSSALMQVIEEIKNGTRDSLFRDTQSAPKSSENELSFLQSKVKMLEERISASNPISADRKENVPDNCAAKYPTTMPVERVRPVLMEKDLEVNTDSSQGTPEKMRASTRHAPRSSSTRKGKIRSTSVNSMRHSFAESLTRSTKVQDKYVGLRQQFDGTKQQLVKERQRTHELMKKLEKYEREYGMKKSVYEELRELKSEYEQLKMSFEKSEKLRRHQKEVISELQEELNREKVKGKDGEKKEKKKGSKKKQI